MAENAEGGEKRRRRKSLLLYMTHSVSKVRYNCINPCQKSARNNT